MSFSPSQIAWLAAPLDRSAVKQRTQGNTQVSYVDGHHVLQEANRIFGFDGWASETIALAVAAERQDGDRARVTYTARVRITVYAGERTIVREGVGAGHGIDRDAGQAHEKASKEAETDARKRALMTFGNTFGLALYDKTQANVSDGGEPTPLAVSRSERTPSAAAAHSPEPKRTAPAEAKAASQAPLGSPSQLAREGMVASLVKVKDAAGLLDWETANGGKDGKLSRLTKADRDIVLREHGNARVRLGLPREVARAA